MKARPPGLLLIIFGVVAFAAIAGHDRSTPGAKRWTAPNPAAVHPVSTPKVEAPAPQSAVRRPATVFASSGRVRSGPSLQAQHIGSLPKGTAVDIVDQMGEWFSIEAQGRVAGWMHASTLSLGDASAKRPERDRKAAQSPVAGPVRRQSDDAIRRAIIEQSIASYYGSCPCPYNVDRAGRSCGRRSAYSRPGGRSPICYPEDVTAGMVARFRASAR